MKKQLVEKTKIVQIDHQKADLYYYLLTDKQSRPNYGIQIEKHIQNQSPDVYTAHSCFQYPCEARALLEDLAEYQVTPLSAPQDIEELMHRC